MELRGAVAIVTGASSGIGAATARALAGEGARVVLAARGIVRTFGRAAAGSEDRADRLRWLPKR